jgi:ribosomal-protein-alanine N-acetyltransferase
VCDGVKQAARIELIPMTVEMIEGSIDGDPVRAAGGHDVVFAEPMLPKDIAEALPFIARQLRGHSDRVKWWARLIVRLSDRLVVGSAGFAGPPNYRGVIAIGCSVLPSEQGKGYGTEALEMLFAWAFNLPEVRAIEATIAPWNAASKRMVEKCGMTKVGIAHDREEGEVELWEIRRR